MKECFIGIFVLVVYNKITVRIQVLWLAWRTMHDIYTKRQTASGGYISDLSSK